MEFKKATTKPRKSGRYLCILLGKYSWCEPYYSLSNFTIDKNKHSFLHPYYHGWNIDHEAILIGWAPMPKITNKLIKDLTPK